MRVWLKGEGTILGPRNLVIICDHPLVVAFCAVFLSTKDFAAAEIFDFGAGPGCGAAGVAKSLFDRGIKPKMTLFDPCRQWEPCISAFQHMGLEAQFEAGSVV